jgi:hypothetical protein
VIALAGAVMHAVQLRTRYDGSGPPEGKPDVRVVEVPHPLNSTVDPTTVSNDGPTTKIVGTWMATKP